LKLTAETIRRIEQALAFVEFGEVVLIVHQGKLTGIDIKNRERRPIDKNGQDDVDSKQ
jgi:hypothetical protein